MLELTESATLEESKKIKATLDDYRLIGLKLAIDDFGTGFSSLSTLADLPIDVIKLDKLFVAQANDNLKYNEIMHSVSELGRKLGLKVVAEGVEELGDVGEDGGFLVDGPKEMVPPMGLKNSMVAATSSVAGSRKARTDGKDEVLRLGFHADGVEELDDVREDGGVPASS